MDTSTFPAGFKAFYTAIQFNIIPPPSCGKEADVLLVYFNSELTDSQRATWAVFETEMHMQGERFYDAWRARRRELRKEGVGGPVSIVEIAPGKSG